MGLTLCFAVEALEAEVHVTPCLNLFLAPFLLGEHKAYAFLICLARLATLTE